ncbi:MAG: hypothetical protein AAF066_02280 [Pseudomonadota bacterium]
MMKNRWLDPKTKAELSVEMREKGVPEKAIEEVFINLPNVWEVMIFNVLFLPFLAPSIVILLLVVFLADTPCDGDISISVFITAIVGFVATYCLAGSLPLVTDKRLQPIKFAKHGFLQFFESTVILYPGMHEGLNAANQRVSKNADFAEYIRVLDRELAKKWLKGGVILATIATAFWFLAPDVCF